VGIVLGGWWRNAPRWPNPLANRTRRLVERLAVADRCRWRSARKPPVGGAPASFCGIRVQTQHASTTGVIQTSHRLHVGTFGRRWPIRLSGDPAKAETPTRPLVIGALADGWGRRQPAIRHPAPLGDAFAAAGIQALDRPRPPFWKI
jgi:hypothetical protein